MLNDVVRRGMGEEQKCVIRTSVGIGQNRKLPIEQHLTRFYCAQFKIYHLDMDCLLLESKNKKIYEKKIFSLSIENLLQTMPAKKSIHFQTCVIQFFLCKNLVKMISLGVYCICNYWPGFLFQPFSSISYFLDIFFS